MTKPPFNALRLAEALVVVERRDNGDVILRSPSPVGKYSTHLGFHLLRWARETPNATFLAERTPERVWRKTSYREMLAAVTALGQVMIDRRLSAERPVMVLSDNSIDLAVVTLAAMYVGVPVVPVSPAYSLMSRDFSKLKAIFDLTRPGMIYAREGQLYREAIQALDLSDEFVVVSEAGGDLGREVHLIERLLTTKVTSAVASAFSNITPDGIAKILFTSGSTGAPKGVITTHRMLSVNQQTIAQCWPFLEDRPPVILDWLPWSHAFGANHNFNLVLRNGGSLYIDDGKPVPGLIEKTIENLREVSPTLYFNAPRGYAMLLPYLERDEALAHNFLRQLDLIFYAGAALPQDLWDRMETVAVKSRGERVRMLSSWGSTETTCSATSVHYTIEKAGVIGIPVPGVEIKLTPADDKLELRVRGPIVTPGYLKRPDLTEAAFDDEGFYKIGDAGKLQDPNDPSQGIVFDGRIAEDFKLSSGTWVHAGEARLNVIDACSPLVQDAVIVGRDRDQIGALLFLNLPACRAFLGSGSATLEEAAASSAVREHLGSGLTAHNRLRNSSSTRIAFAALLDQPPSIDAGEITDKGYINQTAVSERRADVVQKLYAADRPPEMLTLE